MSALIPSPLDGYVASWRESIAIEQTGSSWRSTLHKIDRTDRFGAVVREPHVCHRVQLTQGPVIWDVSEGYKRLDERVEFRFLCPHLGVDHDS